MKAAEIREMSDKDIQDKIVEVRGTLSSLNFNHSVSSLESPVEIRNRRKDIARLLTEVTARKNNSQK